MLLKFKGHHPQIAPDVFLAPTATVIGDVIVGARANLWFGAVLRGDLNQLRVGARSSVQDNCVLHTNTSAPTVVGDDVIIGHGAVLEGCTIAPGCLIGMNATVLSGAQLGPGCIVAAGAVVREGAIIR
ncbi:MAG: gamma carbonic anhydrase family protein, partial [Anaerolineae bacterium]|nr:gamma carbonic anhydrase family protein [Anaerolineae bacterium]